MADRLVSFGISIQPSREAPGKIFRWITQKRHTCDWNHNYMHLV